MQYKGNADHHRLVRARFGRVAAEVEVRRTSWFRKGTSNQEQTKQNELSTWPRVSVKTVVERSEN